MSIATKIKLADQPVAYEKAIEAIILVGVGFQVLDWTEAQIALVLVAVNSVLGLVVWNSVTPNAKVESKIEEAIAQRNAEVSSYLASEADRQASDFYREVAPLIQNATQAIESTRDL